MIHSTTSSSDSIAAAARALRESRAERRAIPSISATFGIVELADAYAVAEVNTRDRIAGGSRIVGRKIGLTSAAVQQQLGVDQPDFGMLFDDMEYLTGSEVPTSRLMQPRIEAEVAFFVGHDLPGVVPSYGEFLRCLSMCVPALEIVDSAILDWRITLADTVADNASCGLYVLGDQPVEVSRLSLSETPMELRKNDAVASIGRGSACMGHPLRAAYWLARAMAERGQVLKAGEVILSGALGPMVPVVAGDEVHANLGPLGSVACRMV